MTKNELRKAMLKKRQMETIKRNVKAIYILTEDTPLIEAWAYLFAKIDCCAITEEEAEKILEEVTNEVAPMRMWQLEGYRNLF